ncbi:MAG TPA: carboxypeptidase-like regulatory domain-containing protein [Gemmatimonadaceae bacterium]|nr:carboxypeptidase-like regulatory domain-containing protein [Gemmatimonadaceae bacterium]
MAVTFHRHSSAVLRVLALGLVFVSCDQKRLPPTTPPGPSAQATLVRLELIIPGGQFQIAPGASVQLRADAFRSDGSVENVTNKAQWSTWDSQVLAVGPTGLATGRDRGNAVAQVAFEGREARRAISVMPQGTFRLFGTIRESGSPVPNVSVTVLSGVGLPEGFTTLSDGNGDYSLYGVSGPVQFTLRKEGYLTATHKVDVAANLRSDVNVVAERPRKDYTGAYTLTISAAPCAASLTLPDDAKRRVYTANVAQDAGLLAVTLTGADFIVSNGSGNRFSGFVDLSDGLTFSIGEDFDFSSRYDIVERFRDTTLIVHGIVTARGTPQAISGTLKGSISVSTPAIHCYSPTHAFEMARR